jgi:hypothetical protein
MPSIFLNRNSSANSAAYAQKTDCKRIDSLKEQQIQRYEETEYASASFSRLMEIIKALELEVREEIFLPDREKMRETHTTGV